MIAAQDGRAALIVTAGDAPVTRVRVEQVGTTAGFDVAISPNRAGRLAAKHDLPQSITVHATQPVFRRPATELLVSYREAGIPGYVLAKLTAEPPFAVDPATVAAFEVQASLDDLQAAGPRPPTRSSRTSPRSPSRSARSPHGGGTSSGSSHRTR